MAESEMDDLGPQRKRRVWLWIVVPLLLIAVGAVAYVAWVRNSLQSLYAETDRLDPGWTLAELEARRAQYPPDQNGAVQIIRVKGLMKPTTQPQPQDWALLSDLDPPKRLNEEQVAALERMLDHSREATLAARSMIDFPRGRHAVTWSPDSISTLLKCQVNREILNLLRMDALDCAQRGDADQALRSVHAMYHCGSSIGDEPMMISQLARLSCQIYALVTLERVLAQGEPGEPALAAFQQRLEEDEPAPILLIGCRGERAGQRQLLEFVRDGGTLPGTTVTAAGGTVNTGLMNLPLKFPGVLESQTTACLRFMNEVIEGAKLPPEQWTAQFAALRQRSANLPILARLLVPSVDKFSQSVLRSHALQRCAIVALAAERFRKQSNRWPSSPDEMVALGLLRAVAIDPYDGRPIRLKRSDTGLIVYCVGPDERDDGGYLDRNHPTKSGSDLGWQLWDVSQRRQPPPPPKPHNDPTP